MFPFNSQLNSAFTLWSRLSILSSLSSDSPGSCEAPKLLHLFHSHWAPQHFHFSLALPLFSGALFCSRGLLTICQQMVGLTFSTLAGKSSSGYTCSIWNGLPVKVSFTFKELHCYWDNHIKYYFPLLLPLPCKHLLDLQPAAFLAADGKTWSYSRRALAKPSEINTKLSLDFSGIVLSKHLHARHEWNQYN